MVKPNLREGAVRRGDEDGVEWAIHFWSGSFFMCGYVLLPKDSPLREFGDDYELMNEAVDLDAPGWLTYADGDWIGFDTGHLQIDRWAPAEFTEVGIELPAWTLTLLATIEGWEQQPRLAIHWTVPLLEDQCRALARRVAALVPDTTKHPPASVNRMPGGASGESV